MKCDQCQALMINGVFCHELGCPNAKKTWIEGEGWVRFIECVECGSEIREGEMCNCQQPVEEPVVSTFGDQPQFVSDPPAIVNRWLTHIRNERERK